MVSHSLRDLFKVRPQESKLKMKIHPDRYCLKQIYVMCLVSNFYMPLSAMEVRMPENTISLLCAQYKVA